MEQPKPVVFLSWSGARSKAVAAALRSWLKNVLQAVDPWMSEQDIQAGQVWFNEVADKVDVCAFAVICVTPENLDSKWLNFEAGAIGMARREGSHRLAAPYVLDLDELGVLPQPLGAFEAKKADKAGTFGLVESINKTLPSPLEAAVLKEVFEMWWPQLDAALREIPQPDNATAPAKPTQDDVNDEVLSLLRSIASRDQTFVVDGPTATATSAWLAEAITRRLDRPERRSWIEPSLPLFKDTVTVRTSDGQVIQLRGMVVTDPESDHSPAPPDEDSSGDEPDEPTG